MFSKVAGFQVNLNKTIVMPLNLQLRNKWRELKVWSNLPVNYLGKCHLVKMVWFPRLLYLLQMLPITRRNKLTRYTDNLACNLRYAADWINNRELFALPKLEQALIPNMSLAFLLHSHEKQLPSTAKDNPLLYTTIRAWRAAHQRLSISPYASFFLSFISNPQFLNNYSGQPFLRWAEQGFMQIRHVTHIDNLINCLFRSTSIQPSISLIYRVIKPSLSDKDFERGVGKWLHQIPEFTREMIFNLHLQSTSFLTSSHFQVMFLNILHRGYFSPELRKLVGWSDYDTCPKCQAPKADIYHCLWSCSVIKQFWERLISYCKHTPHIKIPLTPLWAIFGEHQIFQSQTRNWQI
ncbi:hypothetical protein XELAEV_18031548mg [Xenopus laevis]|uniref:Reverse transcriptase zinc-binding domain-containing protein n=1 Tax=Xenopus laevis TaxID=8355 RepID=A0A974CMS5_XENLA|nr:hypothetical protein XELAEV_18031548mg [Xenopus laevis]